MCVELSSETTAAGPVRATVMVHHIVLTVQTSGWMVVMMPVMLQVSVTDVVGV